MIFKSHQVNLDRYPWASKMHRNTRYSANHDCDWLPRREFEPTRDPEPWVGPTDNSATKRYAEQGDTRMGRKYLPRREQFDTPVNSILVEFRKGGASPAQWLMVIGGKHPQSKIAKRLMASASCGFSRLVPFEGGWAVKNRRQEDEVWDLFDHAEKVLTRLANQNGATA